MISCSSGGCDLQTDANLKITLFDTDAEVQQLTDSITVFGSGLPDSLIYDMASTDNLLIQLDPSLNSCSFIIIIGTTADTLNIVYDSQYHFISKPCGYTYYYSIKSVSFTRNIISTVLIIDREINIYDKENLRTFY